MQTGESEDQKFRNGEETECALEAEGNLILLPFSRWESALEDDWSTLKGASPKTVCTVYFDPFQSLQYDILKMIK